MNEPNEQAQTNKQTDDERLREALGELLERTTRKEAAERLGVSVRTLMRAATGKRLTPRMRDTLTLRLKADRDGAGEADEDERPQPVSSDGELAGRVARLDARVQALEEAVGAGSGAVGDSGTEPAGRASRADDSRPDTPRTDPLQAAAPPPVPGVEQPVIGRKPAAVKPQRPFPDLVTLEAEEGEELVYGEKAAPLITEWRQVRAGHLDERRSRVEQAADWVRMCELELALIGEHGLTLPPDSYPWDRFQRRDALRRRELWLGYAQAERRWALFWRLLRRVLTFGTRRR